MANIGKFIDYIETINHAQSCGMIFESEFNDPKYEKINGWCAPETMRILNYAVSECLEEKEQYLEIGSYCGKSLIAALSGNDKKAQVIEAFELHLPDGKYIKSLWNKNIDEFGVRDRITLYEADANHFYQP